jgi:hypothetical protein
MFGITTWAPSDARETRNIQCLGVTNDRHQEIKARVVQLILSFPYSHRSWLFALFPYYKIDQSLQHSILPAFSTERNLVV